MSRPDAIQALILSSAFANNLVKMFPSLLHSLLDNYSPGGTGEVAALAKALREHVMKSHVPGYVAEALARLLVQDKGLDSTVCLAALLREVDVTKMLCRRVLNMTVLAEITEVLTVAMNAGHPPRTVELIITGTSLKDTVHRSIFERALGDMANNQTRRVVATVLANASTGPSVTKLCLRLVKNQGLEGPLELLMLAWRAGKCHQDVLVYIMITLTQIAGCSREAEQVFDHNTVSPKSCPYVVREVMSLLETCSDWDSTPLVHFLGEAVERQLAESGNVFQCLVRRVVSRYAESKLEMFQAAPSVLLLMAKLLTRAKTLSNLKLHGIRAISAQWKRVTADRLFCTDERFASLVSQCDHAVARQLVQAVGSDHPDVFTLWANACLRPSDSLQTLTAQVDFILSFIGSDSAALLRLAAKVTANITKRGKKSGIGLLRDTAVLVVTRVNEILGLKVHVDYISQRASLTTPLHDFNELLNIFNQAVELDLKQKNENETKGVTGQNDHVYLAMAIRASNDCHVTQMLPKLQWLAGSEFVTKTSQGINVLHQLVVLALKQKVDPNTIAKLMKQFRNHEGMNKLDANLVKFVDNLYSFAPEAAVDWVREVVQKQQQAQGLDSKVKQVTQEPIYYTKPVARASSQILIQSTLVGYRMMALEYLNKAELTEVMTKDQDYSVRVIAAHRVQEQETSSMFD